MSCSEIKSPWSFSGRQKEEDVVYRSPVSPPTEFLPPIIYGSIPMPKADAAYPRVIRYPQAELTLLKNVALLPNHVILDAQTNSLMPQSFLRNRLNHHGGVKHLGSDSYRAKYKVERLKVLDSASILYYADTDHPAVYGHVLLEVLSGLWAVDKIVGQDFKVVTSIKPSEAYLAMFEAVGVGRDRILFLDGVVLAKNLYYPSKLVQRRQYIDPEVHPLYDRIKTNLVAKAKIFAHERIYISRSKVSGRKLINEDAVENLFMAFGFAIVHPQELSAADQVLLFSRAKCIAGSGGSAMHNTLFASPEAKVLILSSIGWLVVADALICQRKSQLGYIFGAPDKMPTDTHRTQSDWSISLEEVRAAIVDHFGL